MGIEIHKIPITEKELIEWKKGQGFICFENDEFFTYDSAHELFNERLAEHYNELGIEDDHDYTFRDWCEENEIRDKWDINHWYGGDNWDWDIIEVDIHMYYLIIAVKE